MVHNDLYLIIAIVLVIAYNLIMNKFKNYAINSPLLIKNGPKDFITTQEFIRRYNLMMKKSNNFY